MKCVDPISQWHILYLGAAASASAVAAPTAAIRRDFKNIHRVAFATVCRRSAVGSVTYIWNSVAANRSISRLVVCVRWKRKENRRRRRKSGDIRCTYCLFTCRVVDNVGVQMQAQLWNLWKATINDKFSALLILLSSILFSFSLFIVRSSVFFCLTFTDCRWRRRHAQFFTWCARHQCPIDLQNANEMKEKKTTTAERMIYILLKWFAFSFSVRIVLPNGRSHKWYYFSHVCVCVCESA